MENTKAGKLHTTIFVITFSKKYFISNSLLANSRSRFFQFQVFQGPGFSWSRFTNVRFQVPGFRSSHCWNKHYFRMPISFIYIAVLINSFLVVPLLHTTFFEIAFSLRDPRTYKELQEAKPKDYSLNNAQLNSACQKTMR